MLRLLVISLLLLLATPTAAECDHVPEEARHCCQEHALAYVKGGIERDREDADRSFKWCMIANGVPEVVAEQFYGAARQFGGQSCPPGARSCWRYPRRPLHYGARYGMPR
jgi:hypothetical protein